MAAIIYIILSALFAVAGTLWFLWKVGVGDAKFDVKGHMEVGFIALFVGMVVGIFWPILLCMALLIGIGFLISWSFGKAYERWG